GVRRTDRLPADLETCIRGVERGTIHASVGVAGPSGKTRRGARPRGLLTGRPAQTLAVPCTFRRGRCDPDDHRLGPTPPLAPRRPCGFLADGIPPSRRAGNETERPTEAKWTG